MSVHERKERARLGVRRDRLRFIERCGQADPEELQGLRYELSVAATDLNGDGCAFPACSCLFADCSQQPQCQPQVIWDGVQSVWKLG